MKKIGIKENAVLNVIRQISKIILPFITFPYITRVLLSSNYGKVGFTQSIVGFFALIASLGINNYAIREGAVFREDKDKINDFSNQVFTINIISTILSYILIVVFLFFWNYNSDYKILVIIQAVSIILTTIGIDWLFSIYEDYFYLTVRGILIQLLSVVLVFLLIKNPQDYIKYAVISTVASGAGNIINYIYSRKYIKLKLTTKINLSKHIRPVLILFANVALIQIYLNSDLIMIGVFKGDREVGLYKVSVQIYSMIKTLINAVIVVVIPRLAFYSTEDYKDKYLEVINNTLKGLTMFLFPSLVGLFMISKNAIVISAGNDYINANTSLKILCLALLFAVPANFFVNSIMLTKKMDMKIMVITMISAIVNIILNFFFIPFFGINGAAITTMVAEAIVMIISLIYCKNFISFKKYINTVVVTVIGCFFIALVCITINSFEFNLVLDTVLKIVISVLVYFCVLLFAKKREIL